MSLFMSLVGMVVLLAIAFAFSSNRKAINFRTVGGAFAIQFILGAFVLYVPWGRDLLNGFSTGVSNVINSVTMVHLSYSVVLFLTRCSKYSAAAASSSHSAFFLH